MRTEVEVSSVARPTMRMRSVPVPVVCVQVVDAPLVAAFEAALSKLIAAETETAVRAVQTNEAKSARALRAMKRVSFRVFILGGVVGSFSPGVIRMPGLKWGRTRVRDAGAKGLPVVSLFKRRPVRRAAAKKDYQERKAVRCGEAGGVRKRFAEG